MKFFVVRCPCEKLDEGFNATGTIDSGCNDHAYAFDNHFAALSGLKCSVNKDTSFSVVEAFKRMPVHM